MVLKQKEMETLKDLQTQEKNCIEKYTRYSEEAKDPNLKELFKVIAKMEQKHYDKITNVIDGGCDSCSCQSQQDEKYEAKTQYDAMSNSEDKKNDAFLVTDCIGTEKLVSSEYNNDVFCFENPKLRELLSEIQTQEQNHAKMLFQYKKASGMA